MSEILNANRTIDKCEEVLRQCADFFDHQAQMNAASHLSDRVMHSPIYSSILSTLNGIDAHRASYPQDT